jgi:anti-anti-sigma factor
MHNETMLAPKNGAQCTMQGFRALCIENSPFSEGDSMATPQLHLDVRKPLITVAVIDIHGEVTGAAETPFMNAYEEASKEGARTIVLNFSDLEYMNSSGIGLLVTLLIRVNRQKQRMFTYGLTDHYQQIFQLTRLNEAITIYPDEASALGAAG